MDIFSLIALSKAKNAESKSIGVYHYKGSVATESALPSQDNVQGDVWNIVDTSTYGPAGTNVAWTGGSWDPLGGMAPVTSVNGSTGDVTLTADDFGIYRVVYTANLYTYTATCNKTASEIFAAMQSGKAVEATLVEAFSGYTIGHLSSVLFGDETLIWSAQTYSNHPELYVLYHTIADNAASILVNDMIDSVNGHVGTVVLTAADVGAAETFTVTVTQSGDSYSTDKTFAEISTAYAAGKMLMASYPILFSYGGTVVPVTIYSLLVPAIFNSQIIGFASYVDTQQSGIYYHHELNIANGSVDVSTTLKTSDATPSPLGTASAGHSYQFSRDDHVHPMPTASDVGAIAAPSSRSEGDTLVFNGSRWVSRNPTPEAGVFAAGAVTQALDAGVLYHFTGALTSLTITLNAAATGQLAQYHFDFTTGSSAPTVTLPSSVIMPDGWNADADMRYEVDILNNYAVIAGWSTER